MCITLSPACFCSKPTEEKKKESLLLIPNQPINRTRVQSSSDSDIRRSGVHARIAQEIHRSTHEITLHAQPLIRRSQPHLLALLLAGLRFADIPRLVRVHEARRDGVDSDAVWREFDAQDS